MPRFIVERNFPDGFSPATSEGPKVFAGIVSCNGEQGVTWLHSYISADRTRTFCVYDAPNPEAIRQVARRNNLPVERVTEVNVLDPYFYQ